MIYITLRLPEGNVVDTHEEEQKPVEGSRKRWRTNGKNIQWGKLAACGDQVLAGWQPSEVKHADNARALERAEDIWQDWRSRITAAAEAGLGYKTFRNPNPKAGMVSWRRYFKSGIDSGSSETEAQEKHDRRPTWR